MLDPATGSHRLVVALPAGCQGPLAPLSLGELTWAAGRSGPSLYFWVTTRTSPGCGEPASLAQRSLLVEANAVTGTLRLVAAAPADDPCIPGQTVTLPGSVSFGFSGCDAPEVLSVNLPLSARSHPQPVKAVREHQLCEGCVGQELLGTAPGPMLLILDSSVVIGAWHNPYLQWYEPETSTAGPWTLAPPVYLFELNEASASPDGLYIAFAGDGTESGLLDMASQSWASVSSALCPGTACADADAVSWSPDGQELAWAANNDLVVTPMASHSPHVWLAGQDVTEADWSGPVPAAVLSGVGRAPSLAADLSSFAVVLDRAGGSNQSWVFPSS